MQKNNKEKKDSPCQHVLLQILSFHRKDFCVALECTKCHMEETVKHLSYKKLAGRFGVLVQDKKKRKALEI
jgi:hypothetical protein